MRGSPTESSDDDEGLEADGLADELPDDESDVATYGEVVTRCGFFGPNVQLSEQDVRQAVARAASAEWQSWHSAAGAPRHEGESALFGQLVRYYLAAIPTVRPTTLQALMTAAMSPGTNYGQILTSQSATVVAAEVDRVRNLLMAGTPDAASPADLGTQVASALRHAREAHIGNGPWSAWSAVWVTTCVRSAAIQLGLETMVEGRHVGRGDLLRPSAAHRVYALEAHSRRHGPNRRRGTYHAYPPTDHTPDTGDIIIQ